MRSRKILSTACTTALTATLVVCLSSTLARADEVGSKPIEDETAIKAGKQLYDRACVYCHGTEGRGDGPVAYFVARDQAPRPRDFTSEPFKFRSTPQGQLPVDDDIFRVITNGRAGLMPAFRGLRAEDRWRLVYYVKALNPRFQSGEEAGTPIDVGPAAPATTASIANGAKIYDRVQCWKCHGRSGLGDGPSAPTLRATGSDAGDAGDDPFGEPAGAGGLPIPPANLTRPSSFAYGSQPQDVYRTLMTGMDGVPMPSFAGFFKSEHEAWDLVNFILSLNAEGR